MSLQVNAALYFQLIEGQIVKSSIIKGLHRYSDGLEAKSHLLKRLSRKKRKSLSLRKFVNILTAAQARACQIHSIVETFIPIILLNITANFLFFLKNRYKI